jgi:hypothetical protein
MLSFILGGAYWAELTSAGIVRRGFGGVITQSVIRMNGFAGVDPFLFLFST